LDLDRNCGINGRTATEIRPNEVNVTAEKVDLIETSTLYDGFFKMCLYKVRHELFAGGWSRPFTREILLRRPVAAVLPYDPKRDTVVLIEQFRTGVLAAGFERPWMVEIVAGIVEPGESPEDMAHRETLEESGCTIIDLEPIMNFFPSPGGCSEYAYLYCARVDSDGIGGIHGLDHEDEDIRVFVEPTDAALERLAQGEIQNSTTIVALQWLALNRERLRARWT
jgi:ADP-ribose pyrophosphatase